MLNTFKNWAFSKLKEKISLVDFYLNSPEKGDIFIGDAKSIVLPHFLEKAFHRMVNKYGDPEWSIVPGTDTYRLTITSSAQSGYYICDSQVLCINDKGQFKWLPRVQKRRIPKDKFKNMILKGILTKL